MPGPHAVCTASHDAPDGPIVCAGVKEEDPGPEIRRQDRDSRKEGCPRWVARTWTGGEVRKRAAVTWMSPADKLEGSGAFIGLAVSGLDTCPMATALSAPDPTPTQRHTLSPRRARGPGRHRQPKRGQLRYGHPRLPRGSRTPWGTGGGACCSIPGRSELAAAEPGAAGPLSAAAAGQWPLSL